MPAYFFYLSWRNENLESTVPGGPIPGSVHRSALRVKCRCRKLDSPTKRSTCSSTAFRQLGQRPGKRRAAHQRRHRASVWRRNDACSIGLVETPDAGHGKQALGWSVTDLLAPNCRKATPGHTSDRPRAAPDRSRRPGSSPERATRPRCSYRFRTRRRRARPGPRAALPRRMHGEASLLHGEARADARAVRCPGRARAVRPRRRSARRARCADRRRARSRSGTRRPDAATPRRAIRCGRARPRPACRSITRGRRGTVAPGGVDRRGRGVAGNRPSAVPDIPHSAGLKPIDADPEVAEDQKAPLAAQWPTGLLQPPELFGHVHPPRV